MTTRGKKPAASTKWEPKRRPRSSSALDRLAPPELAVVLTTLLKQHPELRAEAEQIASELIAAPSIDQVAHRVEDALRSLDITSLHGRAGKRPLSYVDPTEAAWSVLGEAVEPSIADISRLVDLGLPDAAEATCCGVLLGLHRASEAPAAELLAWAPDFSVEEAGRAVTTLVTHTPPGLRATMSARIEELLERLAPASHSLVSRALDGAMRSRSRR